MPYVKIELTDGATTEQKLTLYKEITDLLVRVLNKKPEYTFIVIDEIAGEDWGHKGTSVAEIRKAERAAAEQSASSGAAAGKPNGSSKPAAKSAGRRAPASGKAAPAKAGRAPARNGARKGA
jgi:4-oxalocrotonate tautomerase